MNKTNSVIEYILSENKVYLAGDFEKYRNHVYRIYFFCLKLDDLKQNEEKYAISAAFHDLGIWVNNTFDYLKPSINLAHNYLESSKQTEWKEEIGLMIDMHHKRSRYNNSYHQTVETFRKADWIDVSIGIKLFELSKSEYRKVVKLFPLLGFHQFLAIQTLKNFFKSPLNPLPMFKK